MIRGWPECARSGDRQRGKCRLQVERARGKGYRTVRTTTDKPGRWCKPHSSTFRNDITVVVDHLEVERTIGWLAINEREPSEARSVGRSTSAYSTTVS
jgi:hypothetical protein